MVERKLNSSFQTGRKTPNYQGGFLLDGGVHFVAGLRLLLAAGGEEVTQVSSLASLLVDRLGPVDTVHAVATTASGATGTVTVTFGTQHKSGLEIEVVTTNGVVNWNPRHVTVVGKSERDYEYDSGVKAEVAAFGRSVEAGTPDPLQTPEEALGDLRVLEGLLVSGGQLKSVV